MSGLFNSFYYGKAGKADFTPDQLPKTRVQLFFSMLRVRFSALIGLNLLYFLFSLPTIIWTTLNIIAIMSSSGMNLETGEIAADVAGGGMVSTYLFQWLVGMIPCMMISSIGRMGLALPMRNWARDDHSFVLSDIKDTIRDNWKQALVVGFISGFSLVVGYICYMYYSGMSASSLFWIVPQALVIIFCVLWWMATMLIYPMTVTYDMKLRTVIQNSIIMVVARLPFSLLFWVLPTFIPIVIALYVTNTYVLLALGLYYLVFGYALYQFMSISYANSCFDRFLNPRIEGASINKGLRDPSYDEEEETVTDEDIRNL